MTVVQLFVILAVGIAIGLMLGRWWAENQRARYDMRQLWRGRKNYRKR